VQRVRITGPLVAVVLALGSAGCGRPAPPAPAMLPAPDLETLVLEPRTVPVERELDGSIEAVNQATVSAQTAGRVEEIYYDVNDFVPAGAVIIRLRATEQRAGLEQAEAALKEATAREAEAQTRYARIRDMYERRVVPKADLDRVAAERDAAVARLTAARAALKSAREGVAYTEIRAPYAGIVTQRHVEVGEAVSPGKPLMSGLSLERLRVAVDIPQSLVAQIRETRQAAVYVDGRRIEAESLTIFPTAQPESNTFRTRVELPANAADLYPGMYVKVGFVVGEGERLIVPERALVRRSELTGIYVVSSDNRVSLRQLRVGARRAGGIEVLAGLAPGERIALDPVAASRYLGPRPAPADG